MLKKLLKGLFSSSAPTAEQQDVKPEVHNGFQIFVEPRQNGSQWQIAGRIEKAFDEETRSHAFLRADTMGSRDEAAEHTLRKAKLLIDQQGDAIFN